MILDAIPPGCEHALDIGCGTGALTRRLRPLIPHVTGIDRDEQSIELARSHPGAGDIGYLLGDFLLTSFEPGSFDLVTSIASLHHMDAEAGLRRMTELLRPGGVLAIVGVARGSSPADLGLVVPALPGIWLRRARDAWKRPSAAARPAVAYQPPVVWPPPMTYQEIRQLVTRVLPAARYRRQLYRRYSLVWTKPSPPA